jgi:hypothetical protein
MESGGASMKTVEWHLTIGLQGCDRSGEIEVEDDATDEQIDAVVREEVFNFVEWGWEEKLS